MVKILSKLLKKFRRTSEKSPEEVTPSVKTLLSGEELVAFIRAIPTKVNPRDYRSVKELVVSNGLTISVEERSCIYSMNYSEIRIRFKDEPIKFLGRIKMVHDFELTVEDFLEYPEASSLIRETILQYTAEHNERKRLAKEVVVKRINNLTEKYVFNPE